MTHYSMNIDRSSKTTISKLLNLKFTGREQNWDIELCDSDRITEFFCLLGKNCLEKNEEFALIALIIASIDRSLNEGSTLNPQWRELLEPYMDDQAFKQIFDYWRGPSIVSGEPFAVSKILS